jgi:hypothetical protein
LILQRRRVTIAAMGRFAVLVCALAACSRDGVDPVRVHFDDEAAGSDTGSGSGSSDLPKLVEKGGLSFEVVDANTGKRIPGKLTIVGVKGTRDPRLSKGDIGHEEDDSLSAFNRVFTLSGVGVVAVPTGTYDVTVSRGIEWTIDTQRIKVTTKGAEIHGKIAHVVDTPKWVSGDFHVHAASSPDSKVPMRDRVYEFVADGVDMIVSTDHNVVADYKPVIEELHAQHYLASATGDEISSGGWGHFGAFPLPQTEAAGHGAISVRKRSAADIFHDVRATAPDAIIDVHHPRLEKAIGYFYLGKFDDQNDRSTRKGFSYDFDAVEVLNGYQDTNRKSIERVMQDWFALLDRGHLVTATGNSDTHHLTYNLGGYPRNYVLVDNDDPYVVTAGDVARGVKAHHAYFTTGPIVEFHVGSTGIGDLAPAPNGKAVADIVVKAAPWVSVSRVMIYVAGKVEKTWDVPKSDKVDRFHETYEISIPYDCYALVRVEGDGSLAPVVGGGASVNVTPFALTNPIFLDSNTNGVYDPAKKHGAHSDEHGHED